MLRDLPIDRIISRADARQIDEATVGGLADSIGAVGLINPIRVRAVGDQWEVIAGGHRLAACRRLGLADIAADVIEADDLMAELAMIDENLCRAELSPADRAKSMARRKAIYLELNPETGRGGDRKSDKLQSVEFDPAPSFVNHTAEVTGRSAPSIYLDVQRGEKVIDEAIDLIRNTKLDTGLYLDKLKKMTPNDQVRAVKRDLAVIRSQEAEKARNGMARRFKSADVPLDDDEAREKQVAALMSAWNKASAEARQEFLERIDTPVFDRGAA